LFGTPNSLFVLPLAIVNLDTLPYSINVGVAYGFLASSGGVLPGSSDSDTSVLLRFT
jgi:hypothetical protein